ncbi:50S ribosomal protein L21 [Candidatus Gracilibacteria bacterium]|nr:50S ribosomal protein L21 [Candidatus Gracilibacteria bacterium]
MLAVIELGGNQFMVQVGDVIEVKRQDVELGGTLTTEALLISGLDGNDVKVGTPMISGSKVECKVLDQKKGDKVRVFKMKAKKRYMKNRGFRPSITQLEITSIA